MKSTPAPWYAKTTDTQGLVIHEETGETIAVTYKHRNAQLVAAAPDLLEACKILTAWDLSFDDPLLISQACSQARLAIQKATENNN